MYCIINKNEGLGETMYLAWQDPVFLEDDGYFWTYKDSFEKILCNNTEEHPFLFNSRAEAIAHLKSINIPQKCSIARFDNAKITK